MQTIAQWQTHAGNLETAVVDQRRRLQIAATQFVALQATSEQTHTQLERALNEHTSLLQAAQSILGANDVDEVCANFISHMNSLVQADSTALYLIDSDSRSIIKSKLHRRPEASSWELDETQISYDELMSGLSGQVVRSGQPLLSLSPEDGLEPPETLEKRRQSNSGSLIIIPLITINGVIGTVTAHNRRNERVFTPQDVNLLMTLAHQAAAAIHRAQLTETIRLAAEKLLLSEEKLRALFDMSPLGIARNSMGGAFVEANASFLSIVGYSLEELNRISYWDLTPASYADQETQQLESLKSTGRYGPYEKEYINKFGQRVPVRLNGVLITGSDGEEYIWSIVEDISQLRRLDNQLRIAAAAFESQEAMVITDTHSVILRVNRAFTRITGYSAEEAVGQTPRLVKSGRHCADFYKAMWETINATGGWQGEVWDRKKNGEEYPTWLTISAVKTDLGAVSHYIGAHYDISNRKKAEDRINELAFYDQLTGLPNRTLLQDRLQQSMMASSRNNSYGSLLFIDLDSFKTLNDTLGHDMGDLLLKQVAQRLTKGVRAGDTVARLGGDEFVVMLAGLGLNQGDAATLTETIGEKILFLLNQPYQLNLVVYHSTASIGATLFRGGLVSIDELMKQADLAMYKSKAAGRNALHFFDPCMESDIKEHAAQIDDLRLAVEEQQFVLHYQPQVVDNDRVTGAEALVRWQHAERGLVYPDNFIPLSEETGLILPLGLWVLKTACDQLALWASRPAMAHLTVSVNVSARQLHQPDFVDQVLTMLENSGANPKRLKLELTESLLVANIEEVITKMKKLQEKGIGFSLDDFGTGYSSLSYLKRLPLNQLKIDRSFVRDILIDPNDSSIAKMIVALGENLGLDVIAEGVETKEQRDSLERQGCHAFQGYLFSRPLPLEEFEAFVTRN